MAEHTSSAFEGELRTLSTKLSTMIEKARQMTQMAVDGLVSANTTLSERVIAADRDLDEAQREIEQLAVHIIARRQPVADDLRVTVAGMRMAGDVERIGDLAKNVAKRSTAIAAQPLGQSIVIGLQSLHSEVDRQLDLVLAAYERQDAELADKVRLGDAKIDALHNSLFRELLTYMLEDPRNITQCTQLLFTAKNLERIGDHATNLAENVLYALTGTTPPVERPKGDTIAPVEG